MRCDRCKEADRPVREMLHITLHPIPAAGDDDTTEQIFLCPRCSLFLLSFLGASKHLVSVHDPLHNKWISDAVGVGKKEMGILAVKILLETEKMPEEEGDDGNRDPT